MLRCKLVFQMDNDLKHTDRVFKKWLKDYKDNVLVWPSKSPDLSPSERRWGLDSDTPVLLKGMGPNLSKLFQEACR